MGSGLINGYRILGIAAAVAWAASGAADSAPRYGTDIQPILEQHCYACHGNGHRKGGLDLSTFEGFRLGGDSGAPAAVPHDAAASLIIERITSADPAVRMPPKGDPVPEADIARLRAWIDAGMNWGSETSKATERPQSAHWAFRAPEPVDLPETGAGWGLNPIDAFTLARMREAGLNPAPEASRETLIRRVSLDLTGLPPSLENIDAFVRDDRPNAYERLVDRLLESPHYGERQARRWLDIARYADTNGYEKDRHRSIWPYRDWVIDAYNTDMPYDRFIVEQLAGDLLPEATQAQRTATGFLRNSMWNEEGGVDVEEFRYEAMVDRANTAATAFLGLTMACAQCHTHKYDPITHREYFQFFAFLNNTDDIEMPLVTPELRKARDQAQTEIDAQYAALPSQYPAGEGQTPESAFEAALSAWTRDLESRAHAWTPLDPIDMHSKNRATLVELPDRSILVQGDFPNVDLYTLTFRTELRNITGLRIEAIPDERLPNGGPGRGVIMSEGGDFLLSEVDLTAAPWSAPDQAVPVPIQHATANYAAPGRDPQLALDGEPDTGWSIKGQEGKPHAAVLAFAEPLAGHDGGTLLTLSLDHFYVHQHTLGRFRVSISTDSGPVRSPGVPGDVEDAAQRGAARTAVDQDRLQAYFLRHDRALAEARKPIDALIETMPEYPTTLVVAERAVPRETHVYHRGEYLHPREPVGPDVPQVLPPLPAHAPRTRLTLAHWLASPENPLTARVAVNRLWQDVFGRGIVATPDDFGLQGAEPTHPELLDWLALEFQRRGWSMKEMLRLMVTSATYRQESSVADGVRNRDPENLWLARGPSHRVSAEAIRDIALSASGLLHDEVGGPSVYPPLPSGLSSLAYGGVNWPTSTGPDRYRRGIYTYWKRTLPYAAALVFDAPNRDVTCTRRVESNTPLQALTLLNDPVFVEAAQAMARRIIESGPPGDGERIGFAFRLATGRQPDAKEQGWIAAFLHKQRERFAASPDEAAALAGAAKGADREAAAEMAAWTAVCRVLLNLDETISKT